jgi:coenzyme F420-reducing hydrogenase beta subunit
MEPFILIGDAQVGGLTTAQAKEALEQGLHEYIPGAVAPVASRNREACSTMSPERD